MSSVLTLVSPPSSLLPPLPLPSLPSPSSLPPPPPPPHHSPSPCSAETLVEKVCKQWETSQDNHIIFSPKCPHYIAPRRAISEAEFAELVDRSGGSYGHAKLYVLEIAQREKMAPDVTCFEQLSECVCMCV